MPSIKFVNELGNTIELIVFKTGPKEILFVLIGPNSMLESTVTRKEAEELYNLLGLVLRQ